MGETKVAQCWVIHWHYFKKISWSDGRDIKVSYFTKFCRLTNIVGCQKNFKAKYASGFLGQYTVVTRGHQLIN